MIALHHQAIFICFADGHIEPLNLHDLVEHLSGDLPEDRAGLPPWVVEGAVESLIRHFRENDLRDPVSLGEFIRTAHALLNSFVKETLDTREKGRQFDLFATAQGCGFGFELEFFREIRCFLNRVGVRTQSRTPSASAATDGELSGQSYGLHQKRIKPLRFTGLRPCAKFLTGHRRWSRRCSQVSDEIVTFIREEVARHGARELVVTVLS